MMKILATFLCLLFLCFVSFSQTTAARQTIEQDAESSIAVLEEDSARIVTQMRTGKTRYAGDENIVLDVSLDNVGTKSFGAFGAEAPVDYFFDFDVTGPGGRKLPFLATHDRRLSYSGGPKWAVYPKQAMKGAIWLNNLFALDHVGKYKIVVSKKFRRNNAIIAVSSEPLTFELTSTLPVAQWYQR